MSVVSMLKSCDLYEFILGKYPQDEFTRFSDGTYRSSCPIHGGTNESSFAVFPDNSWLFHFNSIFPVDTLIDILQISLVYLVVFKLIMPFTIKIIGYVAGSNR